MATLDPYDDDDRRRSGQPEDDLPPLAIEIPDDISELDDEVQAYRRELEAQEHATRRWARVRRLLPGGREGSGPSGALVVAVLLLVGLTGALLSLFTPMVGGARRPAPQPPLAAPRELPGEVGGLLPDVELEGPRGAVSLRDVRPAVIMVLPPECRCPALVQQVLQQAVASPPLLPTVLVGSGDDPQVAVLASGRGGLGRALPLLDRHGVLATTYRPPDPLAPTVLLVEPDGRLAAEPFAFHDGDRLETRLHAIRT